MTPLFKVGDKVRRKPEWCSGLFKESTIYTVEAVSSDGRWVNLGATGNAAYFWFARIFNKVEDESAIELSHRYEILWNPFPKDIVRANYNVAGDTADADSLDSAINTVRELLRSGVNDIRVFHNVRKAP